MIRIAKTGGSRHQFDRLCQARAVAILEKVRGPEHPDVAAELNNLAEILQEKGRYADAEPLMKRALTIQEKSLGPRHPDVATSLNNLAVLYEYQHRYFLAAPLLLRALAILNLMVLAADLAYNVVGFFE